MIYIQRVRSNDIGEDYGKQVELGKVFMSHHNWQTGEIPVVLTFRALSENQMNMNGTKIQTSFKVRGDERGGDRIGVDCKEYANQDRICILKQFMTEKLHLIPGKDYFILEDVGNDGRSFNLYAVHSSEIPATVLLDRLKGQVVDIDEPQEAEIIKQNQPLQIIYFGAPGTGKSYEINKEVLGNPHFRTTFHPDTDYASFVGSYKPISVKGTLHAKIGGTEMVLKDKYGNNMNDTKIVYRYVFQAFLKAYIKAWEEQVKEQPKNVYLIIEEINRGNCAQIFGDIFQLLDRNDEGFSDYPIVADDDLKQELSQVLSALDIKNIDFINSLYPGQGDIVSQIKSGHILLLPNNLFIRATMNTSDQSLFPIDSAFKRRWDWRYVNIKNHEEENYVISFSNGNKYSWWDFLDRINSEIEGGDIQQEDKKLGYFFAKAKNGEISAETFLSKVIFFLYNDVFKDFGLEQEIFKDENGKTMTFASFFDHRGKVIERRVERFLNNLGVSAMTNIENVETEDYSEEDEDSRDFTKYMIDGNGHYSKKHIATELIKKYISFHPELTPLQIIDKWKPLGHLVPHFIETQDEYNQRVIKEGKQSRANEIICNGEPIYVSTHGWGTKQKMEELKMALAENNLGLDISPILE